MRTAIYTYGDVLKDAALINAVIVELKKIQHLLENVRVRFYKEAHCRQGSVKCTIGVVEEGEYLTEGQCEALSSTIWAAKSFQPPKEIWECQVQNSERCPNKDDAKCKYIEFVANKISKAKKGGGSK